MNAHIAPRIDRERINAFRILVGVVDQMNVGCEIRCEIFCSLFYEGMHRRDKECLTILACSFGNKSDLVQRLATLEINFPLSLESTLYVGKSAEVFQKHQSSILAQAELFEIGTANDILTVAKSCVQVTFDKTLDVLRRKPRAFCIVDLLSGSIV